MKTKKNIFSILFLLPVFFIYTGFLIYPMFTSLYYSLHQWNGISDKIFTGLANFTALAGTKDYWTSFWNTIKLVLITVGIQIPMGLLIAYLLYNKVKGMKIFRTIFFLPVVIAPVAIGLMFSLFYNSEIGVLNRALELIGLGAWKKDWLSDIRVLLYAVIAPQAWQYIGMYITIFLAALQSMPEELMESAQIDGAGSVQCFGYIVIPQMRPFIQISLILCITGALKSFDHAWVMTGGGPGVHSAYLGVYMYKTAFMNSNFGMGSAVTVTIVLLSLCLSAVLRLAFAAFSGEGKEGQKL